MRITWTELAIEDRIVIFDKISMDSFSAAVRLDDQLEAQVQRLITFPESGRQGRVSGTWELVYQGIPYVAAYRLIDDSVNILRVLHGAQAWPENL